MNDDSLDADPRDKALERATIVLEAAVRADQHQRGLRRPVPLVERERFDDVLESLVGDDAADGDDDWLCRRSLRRRSAWEQIEQKRHNGRAFDTCGREVGGVEIRVGDYRVEAATKAHERARGLGRRGRRASGCSRVEARRE